VSPREAQLAPREPSEPDLPETFTEGAPDALRAAEVRERRLAGLELAGIDATALQLLESRAEDVDLSEAQLRGATFRDCVIDRGSMANAVTVEARLSRVEFRGVRLTGTTFSAATMEDVTFRECRLDWASFRAATLDGVRFDDCRLDGSEFVGTKLSSVVFTTCDLSGADLARATFQRCEMRGCELDAVKSPERLRGVGMPVEDVIRSVAVIALGLGVRIIQTEP